MVNVKARNIFLSTFNGGRKKSKKLIILTADCTTSENGSLALTLWNMMNDVYKVCKIRLLSARCNHTFSLAQADSF